MNNKPKKRYTLDGFVHRSTPARQRRHATHAGKNADGIHFHRRSSATPSEGWQQPPEIASQERSDDVITLSAEDVQRPGGRGRSIFKATEKKPHLWQFRKRREWRRANPLTKRQKIVKRVLLALLIVLIVFGSFMAYKFFANAAKIVKGDIFQIFDTTKLKGEDTGRVNILLAGTSEGDPDHENADGGGGAALTDSIMVVSFDTVHKKAFMMSIPRDLWVDYGTRDCNVGYSGKINAVYLCGEQTKFKESGYADGGIGLLQKVIKRDLGLETHYYAKINYAAFQQAVDSVSGIDITLKTDNPKGILDRIFDWKCNYKCYRVKYPNGPLHLNGEQALDLARARGDMEPTYGTGNDFGRTERQRLMLLALKDKVLSTGTLANPLAISKLLDTAGNNVKMDFQVNELKRLYDLGKDTKTSDIQSIGLTDKGVALVVSQMVGSQSAVVPTAGIKNFSQIKAYIQKLVSSDPVVKETAKLVVLNGSGTVGLAQENANLWAEKGAVLIGVGNAASQRPKTIIYDVSKGSKNGTKSALEKKYGVSATSDAAQVPEAANYQTDFIVILGQDAKSAPTE